ncbi:hypothetical protein SAMN02745148_01791 [Modicisalibacter ilicicola DSM 19980]|uniref:Uncharacterized protein n=1 Tax=Modicisalibacter ilicicola DSM 19980 TaxID=1121942 RepID=A0A1M4YY07_9GAMM|nr:hypothetical protein [Halomonas ilicicola]SHF10691.1 hypothetical protein SAMN02745148_01791 [Halomonas ilicicola DSM 19980]
MSHLRVLRTTSEDTFLETLDQALQTLIEQDRFLLRKGANERAISFRLALHLQALLPEWNVDCEYNCWEKPCHYMKQVVTSTTSAATEARTIYPDIVVHKRGTAENLAAIEIAKSTNPFGVHQDIKKLKAYRSQLGYQLTLLLSIGVDDDIGSSQIEVIS